MAYLFSPQDLIVKGLSAYFFASSVRDSKTRPDAFATLLLSESQTCNYLKILKQRAICEGDNWLVEKLARHEKDEIRHCQFFAKAVEKLGYKVRSDIDLNSINTSAFYINYYQEYSLEQIEAEKVNWTTFFASSYPLEMDGYKDMRLIAYALPDESNYQFLKKGLLKVASDEREHALYLYEALCRYIDSENKAKKLIEKWKARKTKAVISLIQDSIKQGKTTKPLTYPIKSK